MATYAIGVDFGTNSARALIVDTSNGREVGSSVYNYAHGDAGVITDARDVNLARQHPQDIIDGFETSIRGAMHEAGVSPDAVIGIGIDTTGSSPMPVGADGVPLALSDKFRSNPDAMIWLWKDHTSHAEAEEITRASENQGRAFLSKCGGTYSSEWFWSKMLRCAKVAPEVSQAASSWIELADFVPAYATGTLANPRRGICQAGHKGLYHHSWGGYPDAEFLGNLHPELARLRRSLKVEASESDTVAGVLDAEVAARCGLRAGIPVATGAMDAHFGAVGSGVKPGTLVKIMGTSTCDILVGSPEAGEPTIPGVCGVVPGSVIPGMVGIEAGQSAVGDLFNWCTRLTGKSHDELTAAAEKLRPGESGLLALDWNNGNRTILVDPMLTGLLIGQSLQTSPAEVYRALIEATAFGALMIIRRIEEFDVGIDTVVCCGGIAEKSPLTMQIYADVCNRPMEVSASAQTCALGSAIFGAVAGGAYPDVLTAQRAMTHAPSRTYVPDPPAVKIYADLFEIYSALHDGFGGKRSDADFGGLMKRLIAIRDTVRAA